MENNSRDSLSWLHGLDEYLLYKQSPAQEYVHEFISMNYSEDPYPALKRLIILAHEQKDLDSQSFQRSISFFLHAFAAIATDSTKELDIVEWTKISQLMFPEENLFIKLNRYFKYYEEDAAITDAFSRSQIKSKTWMIDELLKLQPKYNNIVVIAAWFGQLIDAFDGKIKFKSARCIDLDRESCVISDTVFNAKQLKNYKIKAICADVNAVELHKNGYEWDVENFNEHKVYKEKFLPDLIINTSSEHMNDDWFNKLRFKQLDSDPIVAIQSNNLFEIDEHINCVHSVDHMKKKFPMKEILFEGELQLKGYKRFMLIGKP